MLIKQFIFIFILLFNISLIADAQSTLRKKEPVSKNISRWNLGNQKDIIWNTAKDNKLPHQDNLEMSGSKVSTIVTYQVDNKRGLKVNKLIIWPSYIMKYDYRSYLQGNFNDSINPVFIINGTKIPKLQVNNIKFNGLLEFNYDVSKIAIKRNIYPSMSEPVVYDRWEIKNLSSNAITIDVDSLHVIDTLKGNERVFVIESVINGKHSVIKRNESLVITLVNNARVLDSSCSTQDDELALKERRNFIQLINQKLQLITPDPVLNREFEFAKIRASESIFDTKMGLVHSPGGGRYYGGVWANDEVEYAGPFFAYLGYDKANEASINAYRIFMSKITPAFSPIPSSFEMGGDLVYYGSGDRGDAAMYAYGASLFSLARGDENIARELWPAIKWSLEYCERKMTKEGVVASNTDEMEGRVPTGNANLSTSVLAYGGFVNAVLLAKSLNEPQCIIDHYSKAAANLKSSIENYFGADIEGYHTYRYFQGHNNLRHWICLPLVMGIDERKDGTTKALFEQLWTPDGLLVEKGLNIFWDRATLYALRGVFKAGATELALKKLKDYSRQRLLGEHIPYPVEAYPEGDQAHLAAESALYCRIITEGLFGIQPTGLKEFDCIPRLPDSWKEMSLIDVAAFSENFDIRVYEKGGNNIQVIVTKAGKEVYSRLGSKGDKFTIAL
jgi:hypothetical protein